MNLKEYQMLAMQTAGEHGGRDMRLIYGAFAIAGEAGEYVDQCKKQLFHGYSFDRYKLMEELGDILWGLAYSAEQLGFTLDEVAETNIAKLNKRYPKGFEPGGGNR